MKEAARVWLHCPSNSGVTGFRTVAELYLLHVLVPLGRRDEAVELIVGEVGSGAFTEDQRRTALDVVEENERQKREPPLDPRSSPNSEVAADAVSTQGLTFHFRACDMHYTKSWKCSLSDCVCALQELQSVNSKPC